MDIIRIAPPRPLLSDEALVEWLRIDPNTDAETLKLLVTSGTEYVEGVTNRTLGASTFRIVLDTIATTYHLPLTGVSGITSLKINGVAVTTGYRLERCALVLDELPAAPPVVEVLAGCGSVELVPDALRQAIAVLVSAGFNNREAIDENTFKTVERLCARYRRISL